MGDYVARDGYALQMCGECFQTPFKHEAPKESRLPKPRISLTLRKHNPEEEGKRRIMLQNKK